MLERNCSCKLDIENNGKRYVHSMCNEMVYYAAAFEFLRCRYSPGQNTFHCPIFNFVSVGFSKHGLLYLIIRMDRNALSHCYQNCILQVFGVLVASGFREPYCVGKA